MLAGEGFEEVYNLSGGISGWKGIVADGPVELNLDMVRGDETPVEIIELAYGMEKSLGRFYQTARDRAPDTQLADLLERLASVEETHKKYLLELYAALEPTGMSETEFDRHVTGTVMEGGFEADEFMRKNERFFDSVPSILDLAMMLEAQALDLYIRFSAKVENKQTRETLHRIADEEKGHIRSLGRLREERSG